MLEADKKSNVQAWELEVVCKNKKYLNAVVNAILEYGMINFEVECIDFIPEKDGFDGRYIVFMSCSWFNNLKNITKDLSKIEKKFEKI